VNNKQGLGNPCWQRVYRWGPGASLCGDRYVAQGLYKLIKEQQRQISDTTNCNQKI